jgi:RNA polymerase sigma-70 factor (ECF subfamily)
VGNQDDSRVRNQGLPRPSQPGSGSTPEAEAQRQQQFLDLLMPVYPKALAYAQTITGSLIDGEDLVSDAVLRAYAGFARLRDQGRFREWFFAILLNRFRNLYNRARLFNLTLVAEPAGSQYFWEATARTSSDPAELGYQLTLVKELLSRLTPAEREIVLLLGPGGFEPEEVARMLRLSKRAVIQRAYRARQKLMKLLPDDALPFLNMTAVQGGKVGE